MFLCLLVSPPVLPSGLTSFFLPLGPPGDLLCLASGWHFALAPMRLSGEHLHDFLRPTLQTYHLSSPAFQPSVRNPVPPFLGNLLLSNSSLSSMFRKCSDSFPLNRTYHHIHIKYFKCPSYPKLFSMASSPFTVWPTCLPISYPIFHPHMLTS